MLLDFTHISRYNLADYKESWQQEILCFIQDYTNENPLIELKTSGSTGKPKTILFEKKYLKNSAVMTGRYFQLHKGDTALLCLPMQYIAGKMMVVRAIELQLQLLCVEPNSEVKIPMDTTIHFAAMVPMQVEKSLPFLTSVQQLIIGGANVSHRLVEQLQGLKTACYATYGMTETVSHIAVRKLNGEDKSNFYSLLENIKIEQDAEDCLRIICPKLSPEIIQTRDKVKLIDAQQFQFLGRLDTVINSGGVKIHPELIEEKIASLLPHHRYFIASETDEILGEKLILLIESNTEILDLESLLKQQLSSIECPEKIYYCPKFIETATQKINRKETLQDLKKD